MVSYTRFMLTTPPAVLEPHNTPTQEPLVRMMRVRVKDKHVKVLLAKSQAVNIVWNFSNELAAKVLDREGRFVGAFELQKYLAGASKEGLAVGSAVFQQVAEQFVVSRKRAKRRQLAWRTSSGARRSLGWIPFKAGALGYKGGQVAFEKIRLSVWDSYGLSDYAKRRGGLGSGNFSEDSRGRWYLNISVQILPSSTFVGPSDERRRSTHELGIDLGVKDFATMSDGTKIGSGRFFQRHEVELAVAQRARNRSRTKAIYAKIANQRKDFLHKLTTDLVRKNKVVIVGNVNSSNVAKTTMAKSMLDAGWSKFRTMLQYKGLPFGDCAGTLVRVVNESYSTQDCSACGARNGPKGQSGLDIRQWTCSTCGVLHDRDVNASRNILLRGQVQLALESIELSAPRRPDRKVRVVARVSNKDSGRAPPRTVMAGVGHDPLVVEIPRRLTREDVKYTLESAPWIVGDYHAQSTTVELVAES